ncbi:hypothetical protein K3163_06350 [Qipengyuania sp. 1NDW9]|uniref:Antitoxin Xre/MbcA/ParS-like toxin-binding domain-containing protein n=1 Tax=Qipengyuania xiapuensis TaxID=2867236 RepID=A0ABX8ZVF5_9SPHN|nr:hypothetical protein [Qipengyuania xiapuensis]MBX7492823.1 hypothetical protein [Qipengyuania xiapuensis]QZD93006.1 hypothetical protein K3162_02925 [Qipengyuania xiapuensis]
MDLNQLYRDHQTARMRAGAAVSEGFRETCLSDAARLARKIARHQVSLGAAAAAAWTAMGSKRNLKTEIASGLASASTGAPTRALQRDDEGPEGLSRQRETSRLAMLVLGRDAAIEFMNGENSALGGRPIDIARASEEGRARIETQLLELTLNAE